MRSQTRRKKYVRIQSVVEKYYQRAEKKKKEKGDRAMTRRTKQNTQHEWKIQNEKKKSKLRNEKRKRKNWQMKGRRNNWNVRAPGCRSETTMVMLFFVVVVVVGVAIRARRLAVPETRSRHSQVPCASSQHHRNLRLNAVHTLLLNIYKCTKWTIPLVLFSRLHTHTPRWNENEPRQQKKKIEFARKSFCRHLWLGGPVVCRDRSVGRSFIRLHRHITTCHVHI